ncbi:MAG: family 16 glycosylhydrolase [Bacteroidia bacterium]|jgi:beta-glucanase (GH16 family)|nr:family 16 glycosylhydrolase [Bacteroidia bacterium]
MYGKLIPLFLFTLACFASQAQTIKDDFEGNGNISNWVGDDCLVKTDLLNPFKTETNNSNTVLEYQDKGGLYANIRFDLSQNLNLTFESVFTFKIYVPSSGITGNQPNQVSLKLQDGKLPQPWSTQSEIIKPILLDQWQTITIDFAKDSYINLDAGSLPPVQRKDFNRVLIQVNGENNAANVVAYIDDFEQKRAIVAPSIYTELVWSDEFTTDGPVSPTHWFHQTQLPIGGSWYNGEIQHYTNRIANSSVENGVLKLIAQKELFTDQGYTKQYTSARLNSKFAFAYGRVEFRAKLPTGIGTWPAVWMLGKNIDEDGAYWDNLGFGNTPWPACGEIDIMEHWGHNQNYVTSAIHTPSSFGNTVNVGGQTISTASTAFHVYAVEWSPSQIVFSVDSTIHYTYNPSQKSASTWPFDAAHYLIINIAIQPSIAASFTQSALEIDYIRVYQERSTGINTPLAFNQHTIYPNPVTNYLTVPIENPVDNRLFIQVYGVDGKLAMSNVYLVNNQSVYINDLDVLKPGVYVLMYTLGDKHYNHRFVKQQ